jgi:hypothetical protein
MKGLGRLLASRIKGRAADGFVTRVGQMWQFGPVGLRRTPRGWNNHYRSLSIFRIRQHAEEAHARGREPTLLCPPRFRFDTGPLVVSTRASSFYSRGRYFAGRIRWTPGALTDSAFHILRLKILACSLGTRCNSRGKLPQQVPERGRDLVGTVWGLEPPHTAAR